MISNKKAQIIFGWFVVLDLGPILLTWINFNSSMDK